MRADNLLQSGDVAYAKHRMEWAADTGDVHTTATGDSVAGVSHSAALMLALNNAATTADAFRPPDDAVPPEQIRRTRPPTSGGRVGRRPPEQAAGVSGPPDDAMVPAQIRQSRHSASANQVALAPTEQGAEDHPLGQSEDQPLARAGVTRAGPIETVRRLVRAMAGGTGDNEPEAIEQVSDRYAGIPPAGGYQAGSQAWLDYCSAKFRSFNSETGTYQGYSGKQRYCR
jgi:hypothetical protein